MFMYMFTLYIYIYIYYLYFIYAFIINSVGEHIKNHGFCLLFLQLNNSIQKSIHEYILKVFVFVFEYFPFSEYSYSYNLAVFVFVFKYFCPVFDPSLVGMFYGRKVS